MAAARFYSSTSGALDLTASIGAGDTAISVSSTTGLPGTVPYTLVLDPGTATEEIVTVTNVSGLSLTVTRGVDGTSATSHSAGVVNVRHMATARDFREPQEHIGSTSNVHGVGGTSAIVGTDTVQSLKNKTLVAAAAATPAAVFKGAASQSANYAEVQTSTGTKVLEFGPGEGTIKAGGFVANGSSAATLYGYVLRLTAAAAGQIPLILKRVAGQVANLLEVRSESDVVLAKFDKDGKLTAPQVTSTGPVSGTTATFTGAVTVAGIPAATTYGTEVLSFKTLAAPTVTGTLDGNAATFSGNVSAANLPATTAAKAGKRIHWGKATVTPNGTGYSTIVHGAGFTPTVIQATAEFAYSVGVDTINGTNFQVRLLNIVTGAAATGATVVMYVCFE